VKFLVGGLVLVGLAGCVAASDGTYVGVVSTELGACGPGFDSRGKTTATLVLHGADVQFAPQDGVIVLNGHMDAAGHVIATNTAPGMDHKPFQQVFEGDRNGDQVVGRFASPRCRATVQLTRR
jgi:hypothetical protein